MKQNKTVTPKQRVIDALELRQPDIVPTREKQI